MINPVIFTIGGLSLRWYGVIVMLGVIVASLIIERELKRRGEKGDIIWDVLVWILPIGIIGARLWYVVNATIGGNRYYVENPGQIINIPQGGLHIFGGFLFGSIVLLIYLRRKNLDPWLFLDSAGPAMLIGQAVGRIANFINQELYGPPTTLPWGIPISAEHRLSQFASLPDTTRFHPTFAYEMIWNIATASLLLWLSRRYEKQLKPGTIFAGWLMAAGFGRVWIEYFFRPDQPKIGDSLISYSMVVSALMAITGAIMLMARYKAIDLELAEDWEEEYQVSAPLVKTMPQEEVVMEEEETPPVKKASSIKKKPSTNKKPVTATSVKKTPAVRKTTASTKKITDTTKTVVKKTTRVKKSSE